MSCDILYLTIVSSIVQWGFSGDGVLRREGQGEGEGGMGRGKKVREGEGGRLS